MKTFSIYISLMVLLFSASGFKNAVLVSDPCIEDIKNFYTETYSRQQKATDGGKVCYVKYAVKTIPKEGTGVAATEVVIEAWTCKKLLEVKSKEMEVYQDEKESVIIMPLKKMIIRNDAMTKDKDFNDKIRFIHDTILVHCTVSKCTTSKDAKQKQVELEVNVKGEKLSGINKLSYTLDLVNKRIQKMKVFYIAGAGGYKDNFSSVEYSFQDMNFDCKNKKLSADVSDAFIKRKQQLQPAYANYKLIDNRAGMRKKMQVPAN